MQILTLEIVHNFLFLNINNTFSKHSSYDEWISGIIMQTLKYTNCGLDIAVWVNVPDPWEVTLAVTKAQTANFLSWATMKGENGVCISWVRRGCR